MVIIQQLVIWWSQEMVKQLGGEQFLLGGWIKMTLFYQQNMWEY
jgi:hypothetical protein